MLLQLENTDQENIDKLFAFAKKNNLDLSFVDDKDDENYFLPGKPLNDEEITAYIEDGRKGETISMTDAHK